MPEVMVEYFKREDDAGFWIVIHANRRPLDEVGPFDTEGERDRAYDDLLAMARQSGAKDVPSAMQ